MRAWGALVLLCAAAVSGCAMPAPEPPAAAAPARPDPAETLLTEAALRAERALAELARMLPAQDPAAAMPPLDSVPAALRRPVTLDWIGPIETLAGDLARRAGYRFLAAGPAPARPLIVAVEAEAEPLIAVLRDAGLRAGGAATLIVDARRKTVFLDWAASARPVAGEDG